MTFGTSGLKPVLHHPRLKILKGDICNLSDVEHALEGVGSVVHLAAIVGYPACSTQPHLARNVNVSGTENLVKALQPGQRIIYASTGSCYGAVEGVCEESTPISPLTLYGATKAEGERVVLTAGGVGLRLATVFGVSPRMRLDLLVNDLTEQALRTGKLELYESHFRRTFLHVRDAARAFVFAMENYDLMRGQAFNVGDEMLNMTKSDVAHGLRKILVEIQISEMEGSDRDKRNYDVSYAKIRELGYKAETTFDDGLKELIDFIPTMTADQIKAARNV